MKLDIDSATAYGAAQSGTELTDADLADTTNPYNLRKSSACRRRRSRRRVRSRSTRSCTPPKAPWLFWVTVNPDTGETLFATTNDEHNAEPAQARPVARRARSVTSAASRAGRQCSVTRSRTRCRPTLHRAAYAALGLEDWRYDAIDVTEDGLAGLRRGPRRLVGRAEPDHAAQAGRDPAARPRRAAGPGGRRREHGPRCRARAARGCSSVRTPTCTGSSRRSVRGCGRRAACAHRRGAGRRRDRLVDARRSGAARLRVAGRLRACALARGRPDARGRTAWASRPCSAPWTRPSREIGRADVVVSTLPPYAADPLAAGAGRTRVRACFWTSPTTRGPTALSVAWAAPGESWSAGERMLLHQAAEQVRLMTGRPARSRRCPRPSRRSCSLNDRSSCRGDAPSQIGR